MAVMQSNTPAVKNNRKRGLIVMVGGVAVTVSAAMMSGTGWLPKESATVAQPVSTVVVDTGKICEDGKCTTQAAIDAQLARLALTEQAMNDDGIQCKFVDEVGRQDCIGRIASIKKRWRQ